MCFSRDTDQNVLLKIACTLVYLAIVLYNDARAERALIFGLGAGCMAAAALLRYRQSRLAAKLSPQIH